MGKAKKAPGARARILLLEDEPSLRRGIRVNLEAEGYDVQEHPDGESALAAISNEGYYDLGILDVMLPGDIDGFAVCKAIRQKSYTFPVIFLTAKNGLTDKLKGFDSGGDDYLTKPFDLEELLARVKARLRTGLPMDEIVIGSMILDFNAGCARPASVDSKTKQVRFTERELAILRLFVGNRGRPVTRDQILDAAWGTAEFPTNRTVDNYIVKFRKTFGTEWFVTRHGTGYELAE